jgi:hypothetical protein
MVERASEAAEKAKVSSFRGIFFAEESLFYWTSIEEGFLASLGMTGKESFSASGSGCRT